MPVRWRRLSASGAKQMGCGASAPLHAAVVKGEMVEVRRLLGEGVDPNALNKNGVTPLYAAAANGKDKAMQGLIDGGAEVNHLNEREPAPP